VTRVFLVEDQALVREGIRSLLALEPSILVTGAAADGEEALAEIPRARPDVVLLDMRLPRLSGLDVLRRLSERGALPPTIILTTFGDDAAVLEGIRAGARGYLLKDVSLRELVDAIRVVAAGGTAVRPVVSERVVRGLSEVTAEPAFERMQPPDPLTEREVEVLRLVALALSNAEIAKRLVLTEATVKTHVSSVLRKLGLRDRVQAVVLAYDVGLVRPRSV